MIKYEINGNDVLRDGVVIAKINVNSTIDFVSDDAARYSPQVAKYLAGIGRYDRETGIAVYQLPAADQITESKPKAKISEAAPEIMRSEESRPEINTLRELLAVVGQFCGTSAPEVSPFWGEETPEVKEYLRKNAAAINQIRDKYQIKHNLEEVLK